MRDDDDDDGDGDGDGGGGGGGDDGEDRLARREVAEVPGLEQDVPTFSAMLKGKQPAKELIYNVRIPGLE